MSDPTMTAEFVWSGGLKFSATAGGHETRLDGNHSDGNSPMEMLLIAMAGCMGIDLVHILTRMRSAPTAVSGRIEGIRAGSHPRRFTSLKLHFEVSGPGIAQADVERAIKLSCETYCSVHASLRADTEIQVTFDIKP